MVRIKFCLLNFSQIRPVSQIPRPHFYLHLSTLGVFVAIKLTTHEMILISKFPFLVGDFPRPISYSVYISQSFARVSSRVDDFNIHNIRNKVLIETRL